MCWAFNGPIPEINYKTVKFKLFDWIPNWLTKVIIVFLNSECNKFKGMRNWKSIKMSESNKFYSIYSDHNYKVS
jgi:hypothetical protein